MTTSVNWRTPNLTVIDSRGLPIRQVGYLRKVAAGSVETLIGRQRYDAAGRLLEQSDPRLVGGVPNLATVYRLSGEPLKVSSVDAGWRLSLPGLAGEALQRWDQRGSHWRTTYDLLLRPIAIEENGEPDVEIITYADADADPAFNLRGQLTKQLDRSGTLSFDSYSLLGQPLRETRTLAEGKPYVSSRTFSPLGTALSQTDAGDHQQQLRYDIAGQLKQVQLRIKGSPNWQPVLKDAQYNAATQIIEQRAGNDVLSTWTYDPADGRLSMQRAQKTAEPALQDLQYFYDRVGNITRLEDHTFQPIYFANQLVDGHRDFTYDSLYRLTRASGYDDAPPSDVPGRPLPGDPNNRLNYQQDYEYDSGGNLIELRHVRAGASHTREMFIDSASNRGVRWKEGDPAPIFPELFDVHGNLRNLQPGKALQWNALDQLESVTLVKRANAPDDQEFYHYSQGVRVYKRHETHTSSLTHFQEVIYLPGLEIRTRDGDEELHVITLPGGHGSVRCLHWLTGKPVNIAADQVRYSLDDHLGSCALELDQQAQVISQEGYYPFGATAWYARGSEVDVDYKTVRYSGKEMDDSGLYYYGARYYAPWLQRWVSADPAGDVDGLNLYGFVGNNPLNYFDDSGKSRKPSELKSEIISGFKFLSSVHHEMKTLDKQLDDLSHPAAFRWNILKNFIYQVGSIPVGFLTSFNAVGAVAGAFPDFSNANPHLSGALFGMSAGNMVADASTGLYATLMSPLKLNTPVVPDPSAFSADTLKEKAGLTQASTPFFHAPTGDELIGTSIALVSKTVGAYIPGVGEAFAMAKVAEDGNRAEEGLFTQELNEIESTLDQLSEATLTVTGMINANFAELGIREFYDESHQGLDFLINLGLGRVGTENSKLVRQAKLQPFKERALSDINDTKVTLKRYGNHLTQKAAKKAARG
jgi:insecticidal toxin complex protein TccC